MSLLLPTPGPIMVLDASVIAKYMLPDENADQVRRIVPKGADHIAPSIAEFEIRSLLCKHIRLGKLTSKLAQDALTSWIKAIEDEWIWIAPQQDYIDGAFRLAAEIPHAFYDCCYLALARQCSATLITADRQLYERGKKTYPNILLAT